MERARKTFNKFKRKKGVILLLLFFSCVLQAQDITGKWYAYANMKRVKLRLIYDIQKTSGGYAATLQIPDQSEESYTALPFYAMTTGGTGRSGGEYQGASIPEFATDAESAIAYLRSRQEVLPDKVGAIGHSEGGFIALQIAAHKKADFIITLAGGGTDGRELLLMQRAALLEASGAPENFIRYYNNYMRQAQEIALQSGNIQVCASKLQKLFHGTPLENQVEVVTRQLYNPATLGLLSFDPKDYYADITCPVLALNGEKDVQVPPANLPLIRKGLESNGNTQVTAILYPRLNHLFQTAETGLLLEYSDIEETFSIQALKDIADWIKAR